MTQEQGQTRRHDAEIFEASREFISHYPSFLLITHRGPDGDAIGASLGLAHYLRQAGKQVLLVNQDPVPRRLRFLPDSGRFVLDQEVQERLQSTDFGGNLPAAVITVDAADQKQLGTAFRWIPEGSPVLNLDHHVTNTQFGTVNLVDTGAASSTQVVYNLLQYMKAPFTYELSLCLYTGLVTDTGGFRYSNTTRSVHLMAADLLSYGVEPFEVAERVLMSQTQSQIRLTQDVLRTLEIDPSGKVAWAVVSQQQMQEHQASDEDLEALIEYPRSIDTAEVAVLFKEREDGSVKVSFRSKYRVDVSKIALHFGGGGHMRASGCTLQKQLAEAVPLVLNQVRAEL